MLGDKLFNFKRGVAGEGFFDALKKEFKDLNQFIEDNSAEFEAIGTVCCFVHVQYSMFFDRCRVV